MAKKPATVKDETSPPEILDLILNVAVTKCNVQQSKFASLNDGVSAIAFATPTQAKEALERPLASVPQAILCTLPLNGAGVGGWIAVKNGKGKADSRYRYLFQTGTGPVALDMSHVPRGGEVKSSTVRIVISLEKHEVSPTIWEDVLQKGPQHGIQIAVAKWLTANKIKYLDIQQANANANGVIRVPVRISAGVEDTALHLCGKDGMVVGKFIQSDEDREYFTTVHLENCSREQAVERAKYHGINAWGVLPMKKGGWGIRVKSSDFEVMVKKIRPEDYQLFTGDTRTKFVDCPKVCARLVFQSS